MRRSALLLGLLLLAWGDAAVARDPIIDMHLHASAAAENGPPPLGICVGETTMPAWDTRGPYPQAVIGWLKHPPCAKPMWSPMTDDEVRDQSLAIMQRRNVIGVVNDKYKRVRAWAAKAPDRVMAGLTPADSELGNASVMEADFRKAKEAGQITVIGEVGAQYAGIEANSPKLEPLWAVAEKLDLPVSIHMGPGPPGTPYLPGTGGYRARMSSPLLLEDVLTRHPGLRVNIMHAGYPMLDDTLALLYAHPQVYVDTGVIIYTQPRRAFYRYLQALVDAGFANRILFGSDQMNWPGAIERSIEAIEAAPFLTAAQKRDILYNNAARFLRLDEKTIAHHHAM